MSHNVFGTFFSTQHCAHPFTCPCEGDDIRAEHSLSLSQRIFTVALSILIAIPTFGVGGVLTFYLLSAALKSRNAVWIHFRSDEYHRETRGLERYFAYCGIPFYRRRTHSHFHHSGIRDVHVPVGTGYSGSGHSGRVGFDPDSGHSRRDRVDGRRSSVASTLPAHREGRGESARTPGLGSGSSIPGRPSGSNTRGFERSGSSVAFAASPHHTLGGGGSSARSSSLGGFGGHSGGSNVSVGSRGRR